MRIFQEKCINYIKIHWQGRHSLARSFWINWILLALLYYTIFFTFGKRMNDFLPWYMLGMCILSIWQGVGVWRSATRHIKIHSRIFWPLMSDLCVIVGVLLPILGSLFILLLGYLERS